MMIGHPVLRLQSMAEAFFFSHFAAPSAAHCRVGFGMEMS